MKTEPTMCALAGKLACERDLLRDALQSVMDCNRNLGAISRPIAIEARALLSQIKKSDMHYASEITHK
jgi:hypothetical protein